MTNTTKQLFNNPGNTESHNKTHKNKGRTPRRPPKSKCKQWAYTQTTQQHVTPTTKDLTTTWTQNNHNINEHNNKHPPTPQKKSKNATSQKHAQTKSITPGEKHTNIRPRHKPTLKNTTSKTTQQIIHNKWPHQQRARQQQTPHSKNNSTTKSTQTKHTVTNHTSTNNTTTPQ